ncbi:hypothetical protein ACGFH8_23780 [Micromonospora sp. NPDC049175]|uniref:hypothetical protein n=1 Tax=Micromonospora sp. NPDC049175 TaxID=3364266 RepID=UPI0037208DDA
MDFSRGDRRRGATGLDGIDAARAYLQAGDLTAAGRALADADTTAPAEVRYRPAARTLIAEIAHSGRAAASVARLATLIGVTR